MTFYQELQLNQAGSKAMVKGSKTKKEKIRHSLVYLFKIAITLAFCVAFVGAFSVLFGSENSIVGVVVLLCVMVFRNADFSIGTGQSIGLLGVFFAVMIVGPQAANYFNPVAGFFINVASILVIMLLGCYNPLMSNQSTLVLGYLLLYGYEVSGTAYQLRAFALVLGGMMTILVFYRNHKNRQYRKEFKNIIKDFHIDSLRGRWQICMALCVPTVMLIAELLDIPRAMWAGIAAMSVTSLFLSDTRTRVKGRIVGNIAGALCFLILYFVLPPALYQNIGIIGGIGVGLSVTYGWQAAFNTFGALAVATEMFGLSGALCLRVFHNIYGVLAALVFFMGFNLVVNKISENRHDHQAMNCV